MILIRETQRKLTVHLHTRQHLCIQSIKQFHQHLFLGLNPLPLCCYHNALPIELLEIFILQKITFTFISDSLYKFFVQL